MLQVQFATLTLLLYGEYEFAGHDVHAVEAAFEYVPGVHPVHCPDPAAALYLPAAQAEQAAPMAPA